MLRNVSKITPIPVFLYLNNEVSYCDVKVKVVAEDIV